MECLFIFLISFILFIPHGVTATQNQMVCPAKFQPIGRFCYHFSDETKNWKGARKSCKKMAEFSSNLNVMLATLDVTGIPQDNQDLLSAIKDNNSKYWLGGLLKGSGDKARWRWLDNRPIHLTANYWRDNSPNNTEGHECLSVSTHSKGSDSRKLHTRASVIDKDCSKNYRYVCQAACPKGFQLIGKYCYFFSSENKVSGVTWDDARKFCQGKSADLAVMGLDILNDQKLLDIIANTGKKVYMGASDRTKDNSWFWLDGRPIPLDSYIWAASAPQNSATHDVIVAKVISSPNGEEKAVLEDATSTEERHFVCQLLYTPPYGQMYIPVQQIPGQMLVQANGQVQPQIPDQMLVQANGQVQPHIPGQMLVQANGQVQPHIPGQMLVQPHIQGQMLVQANGQVQPQIPGQMLVQPQIQGQMLVQANGQVQPQIPGQMLVQANGQVQPQIPGQMLVQANGQVQPQVPGQMLVQANGQVRPQLNVAPSAQGASGTQVLQTADGRSFQLLNPKGQMVQSQMVPGQAATWPPMVWSNAGVYPPVQPVQSVQAPDSASAKAGQPGVWPRLGADSLVKYIQVVPGYATNGQVQAVPIVQTPQGVPAVSTPADSKVDELLQAILDTEKEKEEKAASIGKKQPVKKETNDVFDSKDSYDTYDTYDTYDADNTDSIDL